jgi:uncharacterized protein YkwD
MILSAFNHPSKSTRSKSTRWVPRYPSWAVDPVKSMKKPKLRHMIHARSIALALLIGCWSPLAAQSATPADLVSNFRLQHGEGKVKLDPALDRIAREQAVAMAAKDVLDHGVLGPFSSRVAPLGPTRSAENIAYGYDSFPKTLDQWIGSTGHRHNLLLHGASRLGVASARSKTGRTYWAMVIAAPSEKLRPAKRGKRAESSTQNCRLSLSDLCLIDQAEP